jgi:CBS domain-containing protein
MATVADIMDPDPVTVRVDDDVQAVVSALKEHDLRGVPVVNEYGRCVGIVTESDLVIPDQQGDLHIPHYLELFGGVVFLEPLRRFEDRLRKAVAAGVRDLMTPEPVTIAPDASVKQAARLIAERHHDRIPVVEHGKLVGVVTRADVVGALAQEE